MKTTTSRDLALIFILSLILFIIVIFCCVAALPANTFNAEEYEVEKYYVESGDTLWGIAEVNTNNDCDLRDYIEAVKQLNNMTTSNLYAGDIIKIYIKK